MKNTDIFGIIVRVIITIAIVLYFVLIPTIAKNYYTERWVNYEESDSKIPDIHKDTVR